MLPAALNEHQSLSGTPEATGQTQTGGRIRLECGGVSLNIDSAPDPEVLRQVFDRELKKAARIL